MIPYIVAGSILAGFISGWSIQGIRWDSDVQRIEGDQSSALILAYQDRDDKVGVAEKAKADIEREYGNYKASEAERNKRIESGATRVYVRASCPSVPASEANPSGTASRTAELDPAYRQALSDLRRGVEDQRRLLNRCRAELMAR